MVNSIISRVFNLVLVLSLAITPVTPVLSSMSTSSDDQPIYSTLDTPPCHQSSQVQISTDTLKYTNTMATGMMDEKCCCKVCHCIGAIGNHGNRCTHAHVSVAIQTELFVFSLTTCDRFEKTIKDVFKNLTTSPDLPPPIA